MKKQLIFICTCAILFFSCHNRTKETIESMSEYHTSDNIMYCKVPASLHLTKEDSHSLQFEDGKKIVKIMITDSSNGWNLSGFAEQMVGNMRSKLTLVELNDSVIAYEIQKGITTIPAQMFSVYERNGYSVLLTTMGIDLDVHKAMGRTILCKDKDRKKANTNYQGEYLSLSYPSGWIVDEHPNTQTSDVYISQSNHAFGVWLFRFEMEDDITFKDAMTDIANNWREVAKVNMSYQQINGEEWCKLDIRMNMQGQTGRQISFYRQKGNYIYNVKFGNNTTDVEKNLVVIDSIMTSVKIL